MIGIGGWALYFCFEEVRCGLLEQCSSKRFVIEWWLININIKAYLRFLLTTCRAAFRILLKGGQNIAVSAYGGRGGGGAGGGGVGGKRYMLYITKNI